MIPNWSSPPIALSLTSGREQNISANLLGVLKCDSYLVLVLSASPVKDLMNSRLRAVWMHLDWFYIHILSFSSSVISFIMLVLRTISFCLVLGEVKHTFTLDFCMNSSNFDFLTYCFKAYSECDIL